MSLADDLLADMEEEAMGADMEGASDGIREGERGAAMDEDDGVLPEAGADTIPSDLWGEDSSPSISSIAKLHSSKQLAKVMRQIEYFSSRSRTVESSSQGAPAEMDPEYQLIMEANTITMEITNEMSVIHKFARDGYAARFPELDLLVQEPFNYLRTVRELGNDVLENSKNNAVLSSFLKDALCLVVSVTASTTQGSPLQPSHLASVVGACDMAIELKKCEEKILAYVESRMSYIAPNITAIVGAPTAARVMGVAGGLIGLAKMPACNLLLVGAQKKTLSGFSQANMLPNTGFIYHSEVVQNTPQDLRKKAARYVSNKLSLAARVDFARQSLDGETGRALRAEVDAKLDKLQEPPPVKQIKALPAPIETPAKRRGGRRARKVKERLGITEMRKAANRMTFGELEEESYQSDLGFSLGTLGTKSTGKLRGPIVDSKTKARISKTLHKKVAKQNSWGGSTTVRKQIAGTASVAFTPLQGLEIVNPLAAEQKMKEANEKYFSSSSGFASVAKDKKFTTPTAH